MSDVFNWKLPSAPGYPGYRPPPQAPQQTRGVYDPAPPAQTGYHQPLGPVQPPVDGGDTGGGPDDGDGGEPFIPSRADRPYNQWGTPDFALQGAMNFPGVARGPFMPQVRDIARLIHNATMGLGRYGSRYTGMPAIAMGTYASAYWNAYQKGMHQRAGDAYQQYRTARQMTIDRGKEEMADFAKVYAQYYDNGKITDEKGFEHALFDVANKYHNQSILNAIGSGNVAAAERILQATDSQISNLIKAQHQEERNKLVDEERRLRIDKLKKGEELPPEWGGHGTRGGAEPDTESGTTDTEPEITEPDVPEAGGGDGAGADAEPTTPTRFAEADIGTRTDAGGPVASSSDVPPPPRPAAGEAPHVATPDEVNQKIDDLARGALRGEVLPKGVPKQIEARISARQAEMERKLDDIIKSGATGPAMLNNIRAFDPVLARNIEDIASGKRAIGSGGFGGTASTALGNRLTALVTAVRPGWGPEVASFRKEFTEANGYSQKILTNSSSMAKAAKRVLIAMQYIGEDDKPPSNWVDQVISKKLTGEARWVNLGTALNVYVEEATKLARSTGGAEADIKRVLEQYAPMGMGPKAIRALLANDAAVATAQVQTQLNRWKSVTGEKTPPLTFDPEAYRALETIESIDFMTGRPRPGSPAPPDDLKPLLGRSGSRANEKPPPALPADAPEGSRIGTDPKTGKKWLVGPDDKVIREVN